jgi:hypothetical protein
LSDSYFKSTIQVSWDISLKERDED